MKKNLLILLALLLVAVCALASCQKECEHTFSEEWYSDATSHWHPATCEHGEIKDSLADHVDADEDGKCDVCQNEIGHDHTFEADWTYDENNHWKAATCSHTDIKGSNALHSDEDMNGKCDVCEGHVHNVNPAGYCTHADCGKQIKVIDVTSLDELVNAVYFQNYLVNGGTVDYTFTGKSNTDPMYDATKHDVSTYIFGKDNYTYCKTETATVNGGVSRSGVVEIWNQLDGADSTFGVAREDNGPLNLDTSNVERLRGPYVSLSTLSGEYGVAETLYALYLAASDQNEDGSLIGDVEIIIGKDENKVTFQYDYKTVFLNASDIVVGDMAGQTVYNVNYFEVEVTFCYNDDFALTELWISCDCYTNDPGTSDVHGFLEQDVDLDYDPDTDEFTLRENALADNYTIHATQTVGERTEENPNPRSNFVPTSFEIFLTKNPTYDSNGLEQGYALADKLSGDVFCDIGDVVNLYISGYKPENTSLHFIADWVSYKLYKDGELVENPDDYLNPTAVAVFTFSGDLRSFFVIPREDGTYKLEIYAMDKKMGEVTIQAGVVSEDNLTLKNNEFAAKVTEAFEWSNEVTFTATKAGKYYFYLPVGVGVIDADGYDAAEKTPETDDGPAPYYDYQLLDNRNPDGSYKAGTFTLDLEAGQTIRFYVNAAKRGTYVISYYVF